MNLTITTNFNTNQMTQNKNQHFGFAIKGEEAYLKEFAQKARVETYQFTSEKLNLSGNMSKTQFQELNTHFANIRITAKDYLDIIASKNIFTRAKQIAQGATKLTRDNISKVVEDFKKSGEANYKL